MVIYMQLYHFPCVRLAEIHMDCRLYTLHIYASHIHTPGPRQEEANLEKYIESALTKISKAHDLIGKLEPCIEKKNDNCRAKKMPAEN